MDETKPVVDDKQLLERMSERMKEPPPEVKRFAPPSIRETPRETPTPRSNGGEPHAATRISTEFHNQTPLQRIASNVVALVYNDMMTWSRDLHSASESIGKESAEIADTIYKWAVRELEGKNARSDPSS
jgi:hypothetical protein